MWTAGAIHLRGDALNDSFSHGLGPWHSQDLSLFHISPLPVLHIHAIYTSACSPTWSSRGSPGFERGAESPIFLGVFPPARALTLHAACPSIPPWSSAGKGPPRKTLPALLSFPQPRSEPEERKRSCSGRHGLCCPQDQNPAWALLPGCSSSQEQGSAAPSAAQANGIGR